MTLTGVYDTNVIVSATLKPESIPASLVALAMEGSVRLFLTPGGQVQAPPCHLSASTSMPVE
jgi:hypothetical protein